MEVKICQHCGADNRSEANSCWICHNDVQKAPTIVMAEFAEHRRAHHPAHRLGEPFFATLAALLGVMLLIVGVGAAIQNPGLGVLFAILVLPALIATLIRTQAKQARGEHAGWSSRLATFILSAAMTVAVVVAVTVAAAIAFVIYCFVALAAH